MFLFFMSTSIPLRQGCNVDAFCFSIISTVPPCAASYAASSRMYLISLFMLGSAADYIIFLSAQKELLLLLCGVRCVGLLGYIRGQFDNGHQKIKQRNTSPVN